MCHPTAVIRFSDGSVICLELYPETAPHAVTSFLHLARQGIFDHYPVERIVPGWVVDISYHGFGSLEACYFIPNDVKSGQYMEAAFGTIGMGGYGDDGLPDISGGEFFFPLADCPAITGKYPIFGRVTDGLEQLRRLERLETVPVGYPGVPEVKINTPLTPILIEQVTVDTYGIDYGAPTRIPVSKKPHFWPGLYTP